MIRVQVSTSRGGFVLVLILCVLSVVSAALGAAAYRSSQWAVVAGQEKKQIQWKWAQQSLHAACLPQAEFYLDSAWDLGRQWSGGPVATTSHGIVLGGMELTIVISDEQAKINANWLAEERGMASLVGALHNAQRGVARTLPISPRPALIVRGVVASPLRFTSYGQVFKMQGPGDCLWLDRPNEGPTSRITCWSDGRLNVRRCSLPTLREHASTVLSESEIQHVIDYRNEHPDASLEDIMAPLELPPDTLKRANVILTDNSRSHSLWIAGGDGQRERYVLYVHQASSMNNDRMDWTYTW